MSPPVLYYITEASESSEEILGRIRAAFAAGVDWVQVRQKQMPARQLAELVACALALPEKHDARRAARLLVNERVDVALACGADGIHLPADSLPLDAVRRIAPQSWLAGISCHSAEEVEAAARAGADFAVLGPIFESPQKSTPLGLDVLRDACRRVNMPVLALGGVSLDNARQCLEAGAAGLAGIRLF